MLLVVQWRVVLPGYVYFATFYDNSAQGCHFKGSDAKTFFQWSSTNAILGNVIGGSVPYAVRVDNYKKQFA